MGTIDFAFLAVKVLVCIWAAQLILIGSRALEGLIKRSLRSVATTEETPAKNTLKALRSISF